VLDVSGLLMFVI